MRVIVDTSVWSLALRRKEYKETRETKILKKLLKDEEEVYLLGIILQKILQGIKSKRQFKLLENYFNLFPILTPEREDYIISAEMKNYCMQQGIQVGTIDILIAEMSLRYNCYLLTADKDFTHIAKCINLKLL